MPSVNDKFKGLGKQFYQATPEDIADANKALANALGQIKNVFSLETKTLGMVTQSIETMKGLNLLENARIPDQATIDFYKQQLGKGSGKNGEMLLVDVVGTPSGWIHKDEITAETARLKELNSAGALTRLRAEPNGFDPSNAGNGIYTVMKYHIKNNSYYTPIVNPMTLEVTPRWTFPGNNYVSALTTSTKGALLKHMINAANTEIARIANLYPLHATQSLTSFKKMGNQLLKESRNMTKASINLTSTVRNSQISTMNLIQSLHERGKDVSLGGTAWYLEQLADLNSKGGQAVIGSMREGRNIERLNEVGIPTSNTFRNARTRTLENATLLDSTYTVEEAKAEIKE